MTWTRWIIGTVVWAAVAVLAVAFIWGPDPVSLVLTALISIALSWFVGNGFRG